MHQNVYDQKGNLLLKEGYVLESQKQLDSLQDRGLYFLETSASPDSDPILDEDVKKSSPFEILDETYQELSTFYQNPRGQDFPYKIFQFCKNIQLAAELNADAALGSLFLSKDRNYPVSHQIHCALICEILAKKWGGSPRDRLPLLAAGLTMNLGMIDLQERLIIKEKITEDEKDLIRQHPIIGADLLQQYGVMDGTWLDIVLQHHEFKDGSGYPNGLQGEEISHFSQLLTIADVYCAKLSPRSYRTPLPPHIAARQIFTGFSGQNFDQELVGIFVREFGLYHPGSLVRLANGEIAVVTNRGEKIYHPALKSITRPDGLTKMVPSKRDCSKDEFKILDSPDPVKIKISINRHLIWDYWTG